MAAKETPEERKARLEGDLLALDLEQKQADQATSELERKKRKAELEYELLEAQNEKQAAEHRKKVAEYDNKALIHALQKSQAERERRVFPFHSRVDELTADTFINTLGDWKERDTIDGVKRPILVRLKSGGGSILDGLDMYDYVVRMREEGWKVDTLITGMAGSMAGVLSQMGEERLIHRNATLHMHEAGTISWGKTSELEDELSFVRELERKTAEIYASRSGGKLTVKQVLNIYQRKETFYTADQALSKGLVDRIV